MPKNPDMPIRVSESTKDLIKYMAGSFGLTQGDIVAAAMQSAMLQTRPELDELTQAFLNPETVMEDIVAIRERALGKLSLSRFQNSQDARVD